MQDAACLRDHILFCFYFLSTFSFNACQGGHDADLRALSVFFVFDSLSVQGRIFLRVSAHCFVLITRWQKSAALSLTTAAAVCWVLFIKLQLMMKHESHLYKELIAHFLFTR